MVPDEGKPAKPNKVQLPLHQSTSLALARNFLLEREDEVPVGFVSTTVQPPACAPSSALSSLAQLYSATSCNADAERVLRQGLARLPDLGELQYSLGLRRA